MRRWTTPPGSPARVCAMTSTPRPRSRKQRARRCTTKPFFAAPPVVLRGAKPVALLFETPYCAGCDELHREGLRRPEMRRLLERFVVYRLYARRQALPDNDLARERRLSQGSSSFQRYSVRACRAAVRSRRKGGPMELILFNGAAGVRPGAVVGFDDVNTSPPPANPPPGRTRRNCASPRLLLAPVRCQR